mgnify:CR=1 FL=1|jgi:hypothetical protein
MAVLLSPASFASVTVEVGVTTGLRSSPWLVGAGIEDVNHELAGGLSSQMLFGESFEEPPGGDGISGSAGSKATWHAWAGLPGQQNTSISRIAVTGNQSQVLPSGSGIIN